MTTITPSRLSPAEVRLLAAQLGFPVRELEMRSLELLALCNGRRGRHGEIVLMCRGARYRLDFPRGFESRGEAVFHAFGVYRHIREELGRGFSVYVLYDENLEPLDLSVFYIHSYLQIRCR